MNIQVDHVARLARIDLDEAERELFAAQLHAVLSHFEKLNELETDEVDPMVHALEQPNVFRPDKPMPGLPTAAALKNAPHEDGGFFLVPQVLE